MKLSDILKDLVAKSEEAESPPALEPEVPEPAAEPAPVPAKATATAKPADRWAAKPLVYPAGHPSRIWDGDWACPPPRSKDAELDEFYERHNERNRREREDFQRLVAEARRRDDEAARRAEEATEAAWRREHGKDGVEWATAEEVRNFVVGTGGAK